MIIPIYKNTKLKDLPNESWIDCIGYEGLYKISNLGRVKSLEKTSYVNGGSYIINEKIITQSFNSKSLSVVLFKNKKPKKYQVSRLVFFCFNKDFKDSRDYVIIHNNEDVTDNNILNLKLVSRNEVSKKSYFYKGKFYSSNDLKKEFNVNPHKFKRELKKGKTIDEAVKNSIGFTAPELEIYEYNGKKYSQIDYAKLIHKKTGIKIGTIKNRIRYGWSIEKLMLPDNVKRPVYQYDLEGNFIKSFTSITEAIKELRKNKIIKSRTSPTSPIGISCKSDLKKPSISCGYLWRYASDIKDKSKKLNVFIRKSYKSDKDRYYLYRRYDSIMDACYKPDGRYFGNEKIKIWEEWKGNFEKFYNDLLPLYKEAQKANPTYKRRFKKGKLKNASDKIKFNHIYFSRIDKTEGYLPFNIRFTTPEWSMRYRSNSHRVNVDGKIVFIPQIYDILKEQHKEDLKIGEATVRKRVIDKKEINNIHERSKFEYKGKFYGCLELSKMFNTTPYKIRFYLDKGYTVEKAITKIKKEVKHIPKKVFYLNQEYTFVNLGKKLKNENNCDISIDVIIGRIKSLSKKIILDENDIAQIISTPKRDMRISIEHNGVKYLLTDLAKKHKISYYLLHGRFKKGYKFEDLIRKPSPIKIKYNGKKYTINEAAKITGLSYEAINSRLNNGWSAEEIFENKKIDYDYYRNNLICIDCKCKKTINDFNIKDKNTGRRYTACKECQAKREGVKNFGLLTIAKELFDKGLRKCSTCKVIKELNKFSKNKTSSGGHSHNCYECEKKITRKYIIEQRENLGDFYLTQYAIQNYKIPRESVTDEIRQKARIEILEKRKPKYNLDGKSFKTKIEFAKYINENYNVPIQTVMGRLRDGKTEKDCTIPNTIYRSNANKLNHKKRKLKNGN